MSQARAELNRRNANMIHMVSSVKQIQHLGVLAVRTS